MTPDSELLSRYARTHSEDAFAELVRRHVNLVYSAALRQVNGDAHHAQDVAQTVFTDLARKASSLTRRETLTGWLYTSAHFAAAKIARTESRQRDREEKFMCEPMQNSGTGVSPVHPAPEADWQQLRPVLDDAMHELKEVDREAILLRFFENRQFAEVGAKLGLNENAARMRVERALEKLRDIFAKRGVTTAAALASVISTNAVQLAPANLAATLTTTSIAGAGTGTFTLLKIMTATKLKLGVTALAIAGAATVLVVQYQTQTKLRDENASLQQQMEQLKADNENLSHQLVTATNSRSLSDEKLNELLRLRGEVGSLRKQLADVMKAQTQAAAHPVQTTGPDASDAQQTLLARRRMTAARNLAAAAVGGYAEHHQNQFPMNWDQVAPYFEEFERNGLNPGDVMPDATADFSQVTNEFDFVYQGSMTNLYGTTNFGDTIVVREKQSWQMPDGTWTKVYGFADGHSQLMREPPEGFDVWESQHMVAPPPNP
jgi:RNA polymerase sigma factor (sigma-70 family)